ncbi:MAG: HesA/MoeB/ThiF family protein [Candidatus Jordarchaeum sp.]|uniref:HesA/MoeB/ThiF family protein n=1 Tax=Candidatus Jordarchaeum sp. TaxID=2823881 RepID=UPI00404B63F9
MSKEISFSDAERDRYSRNIVLDYIGFTGQKKLKGSKVLVVGVGGIGCYAALLFAQMGVGTIRLVDMDIVEVSNLQRQGLYNMELVNYPKVEAAKIQLTKLNPEISVEALPYFLDETNVMEIVDGVDVVVDGLDAIEPRYVLNKACHKLSIPYIFGAAIETYGNVSTIIPGKTACLECFYGSIRDEILPACGQVGVFPPVPSIVANIEVSEATRILLGKTPQLARILLFIDASDLSFDKIPLQKEDLCTVCRLKPEEITFKLNREGTCVRAVCGRELKSTYIVLPEKDQDLDFQLIIENMDKSYSLVLRSELGVALKKEAGIDVNILKSGVGIIKGTRGDEAAFKTYKQLIQT